MNQLKKYLTLFAFLFSSVLVAQDDYIPFVDTDSRWMEAFVVFFSPPDMGTETHEYTFAMKGDTAVDGMDYKKLYAISGLLNSNVEFSTDTAHLHSLIRETENGEVYFRLVYDNYEAAPTDQNLFKQYESSDQPIEQLEDGVEYLLYDFSLQEGDTLHSQNRVVESVDSIMIGEEYRKRINFSASYVSPDWESCEAFSIVEGIGSVDWMFQGYNCAGNLTTEQGTSPRCFTNGDIYFYEDACSLFLGQDELPENELIQIFPNPATNHVSIIMDRNRSNNSYRINWINASGKVVLSERMNDNEAGQIQFDVSSLSSGIYLLRVEDEAGLVASEKLVIR